MRIINIQPLYVAGLQPLNVGPLTVPARAGAGRCQWSFPMVTSRVRPRLALGEGSGNCREVRGLTGFHLRSQRLPWSSPGSGLGWRWERGVGKSHCALLVNVAPRCELNNTATCEVMFLETSVQTHIIFILTDILISVKCVQTALQNGLLFLSNESDML